MSIADEFENFNLIEAKVPILRFRDRNYMFEVDLNFNNCVGIKNTHLLYCYSQRKYSYFLGKQVEQFCCQIVLCSLSGLEATTFSVDYKTVGAVP